MYSATTSRTGPALQTTFATRAALLLAIAAACTLAPAQAQTPPATKMKTTGSHIVRSEPADEATRLEQVDVMLGTVRDGRVERREAREANSNLPALPRLGADAFLTEDASVAAQPQR